MKWPSKSKIGLDLGNRTLKALKLKKSGGKIHLDKYFFHDLADSNSKFPAVFGIEDTIKALVEVAGFKNHQVSGCLDDSEVATINLRLPKMPNDDLSEAVVNAIESRINFPVEEASVDHVIVGELEENGEAVLDLRVYCARLNDIKSIAAIMDGAALKLESLDVTMLADIGMLEFNGYLTAESCNVIVDIGESRASAALIRGNKLIATNIVQVGLGSINKRLQDEMKVTYLEAEKIKTKSSQKHEEGESQAQNIVDSVYMDLIQQLQRSVDFFRSAAKGQPIEKIYAIGGGAQYKSVLSAVEATCGAETIAANPFRNIEIFDKKTKTNNEKIGLLAPQLATVVGLALRGLDAA